MATRPTPILTKRFSILRIMILVLFLALIGRLFFLQIIQHEELQSKALGQQMRDVRIDPKRGTIYDRNLVELAVSASAYKVLLYPIEIKTENEKEIIIDGLSEILNINKTKIENLMKDEKSRYNEVIRRIEKDKADIVKQFISDNKLSKILRIEEDPKRYYPHNNLLSTVLGFVGTDNQGLEGLEVAYDKYLKGTPGKYISARNAKGTELPFEFEKYIDPEDGYNLVLTIDLEMQYLLEKHIENARIEHNVQNRVAGVIMDVRTGEILAMTTKPDFNPNDPFTITDEIVLNYLQTNFTDDEYVSQYNKMVKELRKNKVVSEQYEPGSTFKIFTSSMALEEGLVSKTEKFNCTGSVLKYGNTIRCHKRDGHGWEDFKEALANSCNPVFIELSERIGTERFYNYMTVFGFREKTGINLPGEAIGILHSYAGFGKPELASSSFGQTFKITPIQLISGVCSVANGGTYMKPYIVKEIRDKNNNIVESFSPEIVRQTVSKETAALLAEYLENVVVQGRTGYLEGYRIAGKTGTSEKIDNANDDGEIDKRIASFIGFAPADDPQICVLVVVDEPNSSVRYGSYIAAPLAKDIMRDSLIHLNIEPDFGDGKGLTDIVIPDVKAMTETEAKKTLSKLGLTAKIIGGEGEVTYQIPEAGKKIPKGGSILIYTNGEDPQSTAIVPNLIGKTAAECNVILLNADLNIKVIGKNINYPTTVALSQDQPEGKSVRPGTVVTVVFGTAD